MDDESKQLLRNIRDVVAARVDQSVTALDEPDSLDTPGLFETAHLIGKMLLACTLVPIFAGPVLIYKIVRGLNDKDDPRNQKPPPDPP